MTDCTLIQGDCLEEMDKLIRGGQKVDLVLTDVPYGTVKGLTLDSWKTQLTEWDNTIPTEPMFNYIEKILREKGACILFSQEPYTSYLRQFSPQNLPFIYPLYWVKDHFANPFQSSKAPVNYVEDLSVFRKKYDLTFENPLREYSKNLLTELNMSSKDIERVLGHRKAEHFFYINSTQFEICTEQTYNEMIELLHINELACFKPYSELKTYRPTFNLYGKKYKSNILQYPKSYNHFHPTEKPVPLLEDLILTYSDVGDVVLDFTMGSGSTGVACLQTNRNFIGIELDEKYYNIAKMRCSNYQSKLW